MRVTFKIGVVHHLVVVHSTQVPAAFDERGVTDTFVVARTEQRCDKSKDKKFCFHIRGILEIHGQAEAVGGCLDGEGQGRPVGTITVVQFRIMFAVDLSDGEAWNRSNESSGADSKQRPEDHN